MSKKKRPVPLGSEDWTDRTEYAPEFPPYNDETDRIFSSGAASATDFTGLTVTEPIDEFEAEALREIKDIPISPRKHRDSHM
jgi:hypothetical protein